MLDTLPRMSRILTPHPQRRAPAGPLLFVVMDGVGLGAGDEGDAVALAVIAATGLGQLIQPVVGLETIDLVYLVAVLGVAAAFGTWPALLASLTASLAYNFFFLPPLYQFTITDPANVLALFFFMVVAATQVVPGSLDWADSRKPEPHEIGYAEMRAGSVLIYTGGVFHGGGTNVSDGDRIGLNLTYTLGWLRQEVEEADVTVRLSTKATPELLRAHLRILQFLGRERSRVGSPLWAPWTEPAGST